MSLVGSAVSATGASGAGVTLTIPAPPTGQRVRLTMLEVTLYSAAARTGSATPVVVTSTGLTGTPSWTFATAAAIGTADTRLYYFPNPLDVSAKASQATIACPAVTGGLWRVNAVYWNEEI